MFDNLKNNSDSFENKTLILAKRQPPSLKFFLTKACFTNENLQEVVKCNINRCKICDIILTDNSLYFDSVNVCFKIKARMNCGTRNCIYVLKCTGCQKSYIGETNNLRHRINLHKDHAARNCGLNVSRHFYQCSQHESTKFYVMPFFKMKNDDTNFWKQMEAKFINKFKPELNCDIVL